MSRFITVVGAGLVFLSSVHASAAHRGFSVSADTTLSARSAGAQAARPADDIAAKVMARIDAEPILKGHSITATASKDVVTLEGEVPSVKARAKAAEIALSTDGVRKLNSKMKLAKGN